MRALPAGGCPAASQESDTPPTPPAINEKEGADVLANMRGLVPYVTYMIRTILKSREEFMCQFADQDPKQQDPLEVKEATRMTKSGTMTSYKAPWTASMARHALQSAGLAEASINALWLDPHPPTTGDL